MRSDCFDKYNKTDDRALSSSDVVIQITITPKSPLSVESFRDAFRNPDAVSEKPVAGQERNVKAEVRKIYKDWGENDLDCLIGASNSRSCSSSNSRIGFGYSDLNEGVTTLYYFGTDQDWSAWEKDHAVCRVWDQLKSF